MIFRRLITGATLVAMCACSPSTSGKGGGIASGIEGGEKQNGAESINEASASAWFTGRDGWAHSCFVIDPKFGASREAVITAIQEATGAWTDYVVRKKIETPINRIFTGLLSECTGSSYENLVFYFGVHNAEIDAAAKKYSNPVAFAHRQSQDLKAGTSKGFIWVASQGALDSGGEIYPDWSQRYNLSGILMHELGHVYGVDHVPLTIMDARIADFLKMSESERKERLESIDSFRDLYICIGCPVSRSGFLGFSEKQDPANGIHSAIANFSLLTGHQPTGPVVARLEGSFTESLNLQIDDFSSSEVFTVELAPAANGRTGLLAQGETEGIFRVAQMTEQGTVTISAIKRGSRVVYGKLKTRTGEVLPLVIELNMSTYVPLQPTPLVSDGIVIKTFKDGIPRILFFAAAY